jgi:hypothetical protein
VATIAVKNVDERLHRQVKALASLRGKKMGEVFNEALRLWILLAAKGASMDDWMKLEEEARSDNSVYSREESSLRAAHPGEYVALADGKLLGTYDTARKAYAEVLNAGAKHGIVTLIEEKQTKLIELGWSVMEQLSR